MSVNSHITRTAYPSITVRTVLDDIRGLEQARRLPESCRLLENGLFNAESDPTTIFDGLSYSVVMNEAARDISVRRAAARLVELYPDYWENHR